MKSASSDFETLLKDLGLDVQQAFSLATISDRQSPNLNWSMGDGDLVEQLLMLVLDDLAADSPSVQEVLTSTKVSEPVFLCDGLVSNIRDLINYKKLHLYELKGNARFEVNRVYYAADAEVVFEQVFKPIEQKLRSIISPP